MSILDELKDNIPTRFASMAPHYFKELICEFFNDSGYQVKTTKSTGNFGADILLTKDNVKTAVQIRKYKKVNLVDVEEINQVVRGREYRKCDKALVVTTSYFTEPAKQLAKQRDVELWNWDRLYDRIKKVYFVPKPCISKPCIEAIKEAYALDFQDSSKKKEAKTTETKKQVVGG